MIRYIYTFFVGLFLAIFVGMGIAVFYEAPKPPDQPSWYSQNLGKEGPNETQQAEEKVYMAKQKDYDKQMWHYNKNVSIIVLSAAVIILAVALLLAERLGLVADGLLLGGIFTLLYGIGRGMATDSNKFRFAIATVGLAVTILLGYVKFLRAPVSDNAKKGGKLQSTSS